jgi:hypothetical protein
MLNWRVRGVSGEMVWSRWWEAPYWVKVVGGYTYLLLTSAQGAKKYSSSIRTKNNDLNIR